MSSELYIGLISGTSRDGLDAALVDFESGRPDLLHAECTPYPDELRTAVNAVIASGRRPVMDELRLLDRDLGHFYARACKALMAAAGLESRDVRAIGSHGQTVWHEPVGAHPVSLQLGNGFVIANVTGITTVSDFRTADVAAGGQGAPLAPLLHRELFQDPGERRAVLNLGGIANLTLLGRDGAVSGFDTGPANCLMDMWIQRHTGDAYDAGGAWAARGTLDGELLERLLDEPYFGRPPPKSTGLETFNPAWLEARLTNSVAQAVDVQRTLAELTARTVASALEAWRPQRVLVCGGGVHNHFLLALLRESMMASDDLKAIESTAVHGMHPDWVEACLFAWLARARLADQALDTPPITGAGHPVTLGEIHLP